MRSASDAGARGGRRDRQRPALLARAGARFRDGDLAARRARPADPQVGQGSRARRAPQRRREPRRSRRRRAGGRVPFEDERHRRRHAADAARGRDRGLRQLPRARRRQRRAELFGRRQPDAAAARSAGGQLGRDRSDGPHVPGRDAGTADRAGAGRRLPGRPDARRRLRDRAARRSRAGRGGKLHRSRRSRRRPDSGRRRLQGDAGARRRTPAERAGGPAAVRAARLRDDRLREGVDERRGRRAARACCATSTASR